MNKIPSADIDTVVLVWTYFFEGLRSSEAKIPKDSLDSLKTSLN